MKLFKRDRINLGRQIELDIARGLAVIFMILVHIQGVFLSEKSTNTVIGGIIEFVGTIPAAPVFMFLLGAGIVYSKKNEPKLLLKRGFMLLVVGYLLNFLRGFLPNIVKFSIWSDTIWSQMAFDEMRYIDILQFAGLSLITFSVFSYFKSGLKTMVSFLIAVAALNFLVSGISVEGYFREAFTGLIWGSNELSFFPYLSWIFYPVTGYIFANLLVRTTNKSSFYKKSIIIGTIVMGLLLVSGLNSYDLGMGSDSSYYHHLFFANLLFLGFILVWFGILYFMSNHLGGKVLELLKEWSNNVTEIYFIHWIFIGWSTLLIYYKSMNLFSYSIFVLLITYLSNDLAKKFKLYKKGKQDGLAKKRN